MILKITRQITLSVAALALMSCASGPAPIFQPPATPVDPTAEFDLAEYLFHNKLNSDEGAAGYTEFYFKKNEPPFPAARYEFESWRNGESIKVQSAGLEGFTNEYTVSENLINDARPNIGDARSFQRYARLGDTYLDAELTSVNLNESCVLAEFFEKYHLRSATGSMKLSDDTYDNVIKVRCVSEFTNRTTDRANYRWNIYYAKGIGPVFKDGNWENHLGQIYSIYDH